VQLISRVILARLQFEHKYCLGEYIVAEIYLSKTLLFNYPFKESQSLFIFQTYTPTCQIKMSSITCQVINSLNNRLATGLQSMLRCLSHRTTYNPCTFKGRTDFDSKVHQWYPSEDVLSHKLDDLLKKIGENSSV
jgi:hypothetical protein